MLNAVRGYWDAGSISDKAEISHDRAPTVRHRQRDAS